jgi:hypothetical protein
MRERKAVRLIATCAAAGAAAAAIGTGAAPGHPGHGAEQKITPTGVGGVKLGKTYTRLREQRLIGRIRPGCELGGPRTRSATLRAPLEGTVDFTLRSPRRVARINIREGATARGVGIGATIEEIQAAYPSAKVDHSTDETFGVTLVRVPKSGGGRLMFAVDTMSTQVTIIGIPAIGFCE